MAEYPPTGRFVTIDGVRMHAVVMGEGPDVVLIHGASGSLRDFTFAMAPALADRYRVIAIDRPGFGWSDPAPEGHRLSVQAELIRRTVAELGAETPVVLGHSYGGAVALAWAIDAPNTMAALVPLAAPSHSWDTGLPWLYRVTAPAPGRAVVVPLLTAWVPERMIERAVDQVFAPQAEPRGYAQHFGPEMTIRRKTFRTNAEQRATLKAQITQMIASYPRLPMPVEIVHGTADTTVGLSIHSEKLVQAIPGAVLTRLPDIGHMPHHVVMDQVIAAIDRAADRAGLR